MLRILLLRLGALSADPGRALGRFWHHFLLRELKVANVSTSGARDWVASARTSVLAWWIPRAAMVAALFFSVPVRAAVWMLALGWMGSACILNARRCRRTHCRFTGPYYVVMMLPVLALGITGAGTYEWIVLGVLIIACSKFIWWATERKWGKFS